MILVVDQDKIAVLAGIELGAGGVPTLVVSIVLAG
jgi:hypothetical protein